MEQTLEAISKIKDQSNLDVDVVILPYEYKNWIEEELNANVGNIKSTIFYVDDEIYINGIPILFGLVKKPEAGFKLCKLNRSGGKLDRK